MATAQLTKTFSSIPLTSSIKREDFQNKKPLDERRMGSNAKEKKITNAVDDFRNELRRMHRDPSILMPLNIGEIASITSIYRVLDLLSHSYSFIRTMAAETIGKAEAVELIPRLINNIDYWKDFYAVSGSILALGELNAQEAVPFIARFLSGHDETHQCSAIHALGKLNAVQYTNEIASALDDADKDVRFFAALTIFKFNLPLLLHILQTTPYPRTRATISYRLAESSAPEDSSEILNVLQQCLKQERDEQACKLLLYAIERISVRMLNA
ncbi:MAG: HEAT repeat domain-containing protein [Candidatus Micrarchaeota archaeon]